MSLPDRRQMLKAAIAAAAGATLSGCSSEQPSFEGELRGPQVDLGHRIRDRVADPGTDRPGGRVSVAIVGGGIAGLTAGWRLQRAGFDSFQIFELEPVAGGTSRSGRSDVSAFPWGAHYVPVPGKDFQALWELLDEMGLATRQAKEFTVHENVLCREPQERVFADGMWHEGLYPRPLASPEDLRQWDRFHALINEWIDWRDEQGRQAFTIPVADCSQDPDVLALDDQTMADWLDHHQLDSAPLRWYVDYACRDDFGLTVSQTSAWAGLFYFCARRSESTQRPPEVLTWPEGNGHFVNYFRTQLVDQLETGTAVVSLRQQATGVQMTVLHADSGQTTTLVADRVILATPQFMAPHLISGLASERAEAARRFTYGAWVVANLHLSSRPAVAGFPMSWDNVLYDSPSLGYVAATHQSGQDYGPTVLSWYLPLCDELPADARRQLLEFDWNRWARLITRDLERAHPDLPGLITRLDVFRWGHAMIRPVPGFHTSAEREQAAEPLGKIHFAGTDLSGVALFEEAFWHGRRAADEVLKRLSAD